MYLDMSGTGDIADMRHIGRTGSFMPVRYKGGTIWRIKDDKMYHVTGTSGYSWIDRDMALLRDPEGDLDTDMDYFEDLKNEAVAAIERYVPFDQFIA